MNERKFAITQCSKFEYLQVKIDKDATQVNDKINKEEFQKHM